MKLLTKEIEKKMPKLRATEGQPLAERKVLLKFFNPSGQGTWFLWEYDPTERVFFGLADLGEPELGYVSLDELETVKCPFGLSIERDLHFGEPTLREAIENSHSPAMVAWAHKMGIL